MIAYYSKSLNPAQQKYCTTKRELLAVVSTLDHFKGYVWGPHFSVRTDHAALVWLTNLKNIQGMLARWLAKLQQFNFDIEHRPGTQHGHADYYYYYSPWIGPYKVVHAPMEWVVGIQVDADARIFYVHMDDQKRCAPPDPTTSWPDVACSTSIVLSTRTPSTVAHTIADPTPTKSDKPQMAMSEQSTQSENFEDNDVRAPPITVHTERSHDDTGAPSITI